MPVFHPARLQVVYIDLKGESLANKLTLTQPLWPSGFRLVELSGVEPPTS